MVTRLVRALLRKCGLDVVRYSPFPADFTERHVEVIKRVKGRTVTTDERLFGLIEAVRHVLANGVPGAFVECGVFMGGSSMAMALTLLAEGVDDREIHLFDTFEGMPEPGEKDVDLWGKPAVRRFSRERLSDVSSTWTSCPLDAVREAMFTTGYPKERIHFVKGLVEETIPGQAPESIALLRLDTDWYQSTKHELNHLYPRVPPGGVVIIDDYGHFRGAKEAADEYFAELQISPYLHRMDYTGRLFVK
jgi:hypothetical protein